MEDHIEFLDFLVRSHHVPKNIAVKTVLAIMRCEGMYLKVIENLEEANSKIPCISRAIERMKYRLEPLKGETLSWCDSAKSLSQKAKEFVYKSKLSDGQIAACNKASMLTSKKFLRYKKVIGLSIAKQLSSHAALDTYNYVRLEFSQLLPNFLECVPEFRGNPFESYVEIREQGIVPRDLKYIKEKISVDAILRANGKIFWVSYIEGENKFDYFRHLGESYREMKHIKYLYEF